MKKEGEDKAGVARRCLSRPHPSLQGRGRSCRCVLHRARGWAGRSGAPIPTGGASPVVRPAMEMRRGYGERLKR
jgi:hypothetical protein